MKSKLSGILLLTISCFLVFFIVAIPLQAASVESNLAGTLPKYPENGQTYWIAFKEGYRSGRIELSTCNISGKREKAYIKWSRNLTLQGANASGRYNQYKLAESGKWEQIGTYVRFSDYATSIIASNLDVYDSEGNLIMAKTKKYPRDDQKIDISKADVSNIGENIYTGKAIKPHPKVTYKGKYLYEGKDYILSYKNNKEAGVASVLIKGKGSFKGTRTIKFKIVKKPKASIKLSKSSLALSLAGMRTHTVKVTKEKISSKLKWKSSNTSVVTVKDGKITAKGVGTAKVTVSADGVAATCKVTVKDTAVKTVTLSFKSFDDWTKKVQNKEMGLVFGGKNGINADGSTYYTGNIIVKRQIESYKKVKVKISLNTPGHYRTVNLMLPNKIKYTLHRHNLKNNFSSDSVGKIMVGVMERQLVWTQKCSCGYENKITWDIPIQKKNKIKDGGTYKVQTNSLVE